MQRRGRLQDIPQSTRTSMECRGRNHTQNIGPSVESALAVFFHGKISVIVACFKKCSSPYVSWYRHGRGSSLLFFSTQTHLSLALVSVCVRISVKSSKGSGWLLNIHGGSAAGQATSQSSTPKGKDLLCMLASNAAPNASQILKLETEELLPDWLYLQPFQIWYHMRVRQRDSSVRENSMWWRYLCGTDQACGEGSWITDSVMSSDRVMCFLPHL